MIPFIPNRRPMIGLYGYGGGDNYADNIHGIAAGFRANPSAQAALMREWGAGIDCEYIISMPQGNTAGNQFCASCDGIIAANAPLAAIKAFSETFDRLGQTWWLYTGFILPKVGGVAVEDGTSQETGGTGVVKCGLDNVDFLLAQTAKWRARGFRLAFDASDDDADELVLLALEDTLGYKPISEPIPLTYHSGSPSDNSIRTDDVTRRAYINIYRGFHESRDPNETWTVNPWTTEVHVVIDAQFSAYTETEGRRRLNSLAARGFVVDLYGGGFPDYVRQWWRTTYANSRSRRYDR